MGLPVGIHTVADDIEDFVATGESQNEQAPLAVVRALSELAIGFRSDRQSRTALSPLLAAESLTIGEIASRTMTDVSDVQKEINDLIRVGLVENKIVDGWSRHSLVTP